MVLAWVVGVCAIPLWQYLALFVLPGASMTLVRSFAEHKAAGTPLERTALIEAGRFFSVLYLNNNLHYAHHERPDLPWHALPAYYRGHRERLLRENGSLLYRGYREHRRALPAAPGRHPGAPVFLTRGPARSCRVLTKVTARAFQDFAGRHGPRRADACVTLPAACDAAPTLASLDPRRPRRLSKAGARRRARFAAMAGLAAMGWERCSDPSGRGWSPR